MFKLKSAQLERYVHIRHAERCESCEVAYNWIGMLKGGIEILVREFKENGQGYVIMERSREQDVQNKHNY